MHNQASQCMQVMHVVRNYEYNKTTLSIILLSSVQYQPHTFVILLPRHESYGAAQEPLLQTKSSEQSSSVEQDAPKQCPAQEQEAVEVGLVVVVFVGGEPERPRLDASALTSLSPMLRRVVKLVM